jgi:hypothetical protein
MVYSYSMFSESQDIVENVSWKENKFTDLFDYDCTGIKKKKLIYVQPQSTRYYLPLLKKLGENYRVKHLISLCHKI